MIFGAVAAVLRYNAFSRLLSELVSMVLGIPILCFFDDFGSIVPADLAERALATFTSFCSKLGIQLKTAKSEWCQKVTFLGLGGSFPREPNGFKLSVALTAGKAFRWADEVTVVIKNREIPAQELGDLIGNPGFSQTNLFGKFARTQLRPLYAKFYSMGFSPSLPNSEIRAFHWRPTRLRSLQPRIPRPANRRRDLVVYTDAALLTRRIEDPSISARGHVIRADLLAVSTTPKAWFPRFNRRIPIVGVEMLGPMDFLRDASRFLRSKRINLYVDNDAASTALIRGDCADAFLSATIKVFRKLVEKLQLDIWVGRVGTSVNPAGLPTRKKNPPFPVESSIPFKSLFSLHCEALKMVR